MSADTILVSTTDVAATRGRGPKELQVGVLAENVTLFMAQIEGILAKTPEEVGEKKFKLTELTVTAEISAKGALVLLGTGVEASGKGGLTFKFQRK